MIPTSEETTLVPILYVENEPEARAMVVRVITAVNPALRFYCAGNGEDGLSLFREHRPGIVITDIRMPVMNGIKMSNEIRALAPETPIIVVTACSDAEFLLQSINGDPAECVVKPVDYDKLLAAINRGLATIALRNGEEQNPK